MSKCRVCKLSEAEWAWQPFGPDEGIGSFALLGNHYRGFPVVKICEQCKDDIQAGLPMEFEYKGTRYIAGDDEVLAVPGYVGDPLHWWVATHE